jgi:ABC-type lipoprotein release transport system permease subunit
MFFFLRLAYGNLIKNRRSSITILIVVFVCVFFMEFGTGYMDGFRAKIVKDFLREAGHVKIYNREYYKELDFSMVEYNVKYDDKFISKLKGVPGVQAVLPEMNFGALANSTTENVECMIKGVELEKIAANYPKRKSSISEGRFIENDKELVLGYKIAKTLKVGVGDNLVVLSVDQYGGVNAVEGKIVGLSKTNNPVDDEGLVLCPITLAQKLLAVENCATDITVNLDDPFTAPDRAVIIQAMLPADLQAVPWQQGQSYIMGLLALMNVAVFALAFVIIFAASMGIINSFLMNIMNRLPEYGVLRAMGVSKSQMFFMIIAESFLLGLTGTVAGLIPGTILVKYFEVNPFSYEKIWQVLGSSGLGAMDASIGTVLIPASLAVVFLTGVLIAVIASLYPAISAIRKKPSEILRVLE